MSYRNKQKIKDSALVVLVIVIILLSIFIYLSSQNEITEEERFDPNAPESQELEPGNPGNL